MADVSVQVENQNPKELLAQGKRAYILQDYNAAVTALSRTTELLVEEHGDDLHEALGEVYLYYGKALLALSRSESDALGDAVPKNETEEDDEEEEEEEGEEANENDANEKKDVEKDQDSEMKTVEEEEKTEEKEKDNKEAEEKKEEGEEKNVEEAEEADEEPTDLQVAWEVLEFAKKIFEKKGEDGKKSLADSLIVLGEISLESENFEAAVNDMKQGLEIQEKAFSKDSRTVAETLYKLGVAYSTNTQIEEAVSCFTRALEYLKNRINVLEAKEDKKDGVNEEIDEIKALMPEIEEKIVDMKNYKEEAIKNLASALNDQKPGESSGGGSSSSKQATDISHLVKRKRKLDDAAENGDSPAKKAAAE